MPLRAIVAVAALVMATVAGQNTLLNSEAHIAAIPPCAQGACTPASQDTAFATVLGHEVLPGGCHNGDLHVMRYVPDTASNPLVAAWCR
jgi:hypothetical protein